MSTWDAWIGRKETRSDRINDSLVDRWLATFDWTVPTNKRVPQGLHWCLCVPDAPTARLGQDGHPKRDDSAASFLPPVPLPRRMWASSSIAFHLPLRRKDAITRISTVQSITEKTGGSGDLVFVDVAHKTYTDEGLAISELQSLVYREATYAAAPQAAPPLGQEVFDSTPWNMHQMIEPSETLLYRFSALTFNSHRIHYDLRYATCAENYRGLVVQGPLTASLLLNLAQHELGDNSVATFEFRGLSPAISGEPLHLVMRNDEGAFYLAAFAGDGREIMNATATLGAEQ